MNADLAFGKRAVFLSLALAILLGCQDNVRLARLEKDNSDLKAQLQDKNKVRDYDLGVRCSKDAKAWFNQNYSRDKDTMMLDFQNHYNLASNQCFIFIEYHFSSNSGRSWTNSMSLYNVYENARYGNYLEEHVIGFDHDDPKDKILICETFDEKCTSLDQFNKFVRPYLNN
jgi:hypothetical protein